MLNLRGINFGNVLLASGAANFFKQRPWWFRRIVELIPGANDDGATHTSKTSVLLSRKGNMELEKDLQPKEWFPKCIRIYWRRRFVMNAVGLSGPGFEALLETGLWQQMIKPFLISIMAIGDTLENRLKEIRVMALLLRINKHKFMAPSGIELNGSCPNTEHCPLSLADGLIRQGEEVRVAGVPSIVKINVLTSFETISRIIRSGVFDALLFSNTIKFGQLPEWIPWDKLFKSGKSPLAEFGGGAYSGWHAIFAVARLLRRIEEAGLRIPIIAGNGILYPHDVDFLAKASPNNLKAISYGSLRLLRPWNEKRVIRRANELLGSR